MGFRSLLRPCHESARHCSTARIGSLPINTDWCRLGCSGLCLEQLNTSQRMSQCPDIGQGQANVHISKCPPQVPDCDLEQNQTFHSVHISECLASRIPIMLQRYENFMKTNVAGIVLVLILSTETCLCDNYGPSYVHFPNPPQNHGSLLLVFVK